MGAEEQQEDRPTKCPERPIVNKKKILRKPVAISRNNFDPDSLMNTTCGWGGSFHPTKKKSSLAMQASHLSDLAASSRGGALSCTGLPALKPAPSLLSASLKHFPLESRAMDRERRWSGTIRYVGYTAFEGGVWVGLELDDPLGNNDGSIGGQRYFKCPRGYGIFLRPKKLDVIPGGHFCPNPRSSREYLVHETEHELWSYKNRPNTVGIQSTESQPLQKEQIKKKVARSDFFITEENDTDDCEGKTPVLDGELLKT
eukprot:UC4_evm12s1044